MVACDPTKVVISMTDPMRYFVMGDGIDFERALSMVYDHMNFAMVIIQ